MCIRDSLRAVRFREQGRWTLRHQVRLKPDTTGAGSLRRPLTDVLAQPDTKWFQRGDRLRDITGQICRRHFSDAERFPDVDVFHPQKLDAWMRGVVAARWFVQPRVRIDLEALPRHRCDDYGQFAPGTVIRDRRA